MQHSSMVKRLVIAAVVMSLGLFGGAALAGPGDQACEGPAAAHNPNCVEGQLITPVCETPAGDNNPFCANDGAGPPPEDPPNDTPGGPPDDNGNGNGDTDDCVVLAGIDPALEPLDAAVVCPLLDALG